MKLQITLLSTIALHTIAFAQEKPKEIKFEVQTIEIVNGKETRFDTSFTSSNPSDVAKIKSLTTKRIANDSLSNVPSKIYFIDSIKLDDKIMPEFVINTEETAAGAKKMMTITVSDKVDPQIAEQLRNQMNNIHTEQDTMIGKTFIIKKVGKCDASKEEIENTEIEYHITITSKVMVCEFSAGERKTFSNKLISTPDNLTFAENVRCTPNPSNGKFNLSFELKNTSEVSVEILSPAGEILYHETLANFGGKYNKEINTGSLAKGVYALRITQGAFSTVKKLIIE